LLRAVADSSTLIALSRSDVVDLFAGLDVELLAPKEVEEELERRTNRRILSHVRVIGLRAKTLYKCRELQNLGIGKGEAACCALALRLALGFILCDDAKFIRQKFFSQNRTLQALAVFGFSYILYHLHKQGLVGDVWPHFTRIIRSNNWERSEVQTANYTFLREMGL
jgi:predicted nucleic acid-binding protein